MNIPTLHNAEIPIARDCLAPGEPLSTPDDIMDIAQAAAFLGIKENTLYKYTSARTIPHYKPSGCKLFFSKIELCQWVAKGRVPTMDELKRAAHRL